MPRWDRDGGRIKQTIFECAAYKYNVRAKCRGCGRVSVLQPHALWWRFVRRGWDDDLRRGAAHLRCGTCGGTPATLEPTPDAVTVDALPMPPESEWKRAVNRLRN